MFESCRPDQKFYKKALTYEQIQEVGWLTCKGFLFVTARAT